MMTLRQLKARARRRNHERGAVIFIVAMTLAVLASIGLYALTSASTEVKTSGYGRQNSQSRYLSEYGVQVGANAMGGTTGQLYVGLMKSTVQRDGACTSLIGVDVNASSLSKACRRMGAVELANAWGTSKTAVEPVAANKAGSLGFNDMTGDFYVELTDPAPAGAMYGIDTRLGLCYTKITVLAVGITRPDTIALAAKGITLGDRALYGSQGLINSRARVVAGPMRDGCQ
ncbi:hypothetical protein BH09MYX1_BH09MYX1_12430 [soil metagenome]